jgi:hypothetical protein
MGCQNKITVTGTYSKEGFIWIAYLPLIHLSAHALTPYKCLESLSLSLEQLIANESFHFEIRITDNAKIVLLADESEAFQAFVQSRSQT